MHDFSIVLPSPFGGKARLPRSTSSPALPDFSRSHFNHTPSTNLQDGLPQSASLPILPNFDWNLDTEKETKQEITNELPETTDDQLNRVEREVPQPINVEKRDLKKQSRVTGPKIWIQKVKGQLVEHQSIEEKADTSSDISNSKNVSHKSYREIFPRAMSAPLASIARKSWIVPKTSQKIMNIGKNVPQDKMNAETKTDQFRSSTMPKVKCSSNHFLDFSQKLPKMTFHNFFENPSSTHINSLTLDSTNSSTSSLHESSIDSQSTPRTSTDKVHNLSVDITAEKDKQNPIEIIGKRDELYSAFRALENSYTKFQSKSTSLRTNIVRSSLIPFLRTYSKDTSIRNLQPEDLERRVNILNKWWIGLIKTLDGKYNQAVSGLDRPVILQGCFEIMIRPEWRFSLSVPISGDRSPNRSTSRLLLLSKKSPSSSSLANFSQLVASVNQKIRSLFIKNLTLQLNFAIEKMSLRCTPPYLVTFSGKTVAYAFLFVPGVAELLVHIWKLSISVLRRVSDQLDLPRREIKIDLDEVITSFPVHTHSLAWCSLKSTSNFLRKTPKIPVMTENIAWYGPWVTRWCGKESDLFFIFAKYYYILCEEIFPPDLSLKQKARAPGYLLVMAQTLVVIDETIHRQPVVDPLPITFDDVLAKADTSATPLTLPSNNSARLMAENRLIILLRDFLSESPSDHKKARTTFGQLLENVIQAAAKRTSLFDSSACFILCDFMEEALNVFVRSHESNNIIDWYFWLDVCKKILQSENTMSEIRLFALLFGIWDVITAVDQRKDIICLKWLLTEDLFDKYFNHWCPMVRAYYMRLLCWRVCRNDGESSDLDTSNWTYYLHLREQAETRNSLPPSTSPSLPAPGRRFLIIRNDNPLPDDPLFMSLDALSSRSGRSSIQSISCNRDVSLSQYSMTETYSATDPTVNSNTPKLAPNPQTPTINFNKKRSSFLEKLFYFTFPDFNSNKYSDEFIDTPRKRSVSSDGDNPYSTHEFRDKVSMPSQYIVNDDENDKLGDTLVVHRSFSFRFSLECGAQFENGISGGTFSGNLMTNGSTFNSTGILAPGHGLGDRKLSQPRLPAPAQALLAAKMAKMNQKTMKDFPSAENCTESYSDALLSPLVPTTPLNNVTSFISKSTQEEVIFLPSPVDLNISTSNGREISTKTAVYKGRALAEWAIVVGECNGFLERRRNEGVPNLKMVEVPILSVEGLRRY